MSIEQYINTVLFLFTDIIKNRKHYLHKIILYKR